MRHLSRPVQEGTPQEGLRALVYVNRVMQAQLPHRTLVKAAQALVREGRPPLRALCKVARASGADSAGVLRSLRHWLPAKAVGDAIPSGFLTALCNRSPNHFRCEVNAAYDEVRAMLDVGKGINVGKNGLDDGDRVAIAFWLALDEEDSEDEACCAT